MTADGPAAERPVADWERELLGDDADRSWDDWEALVQIAATAITEVNGRTFRISGDLYRAVARAVQDAGFHR